MEIHLVRFLIKHGIIPLFTSFFQSCLYQKCCKNTEKIVFSQNKKFGLSEIISRCTLPNMKVCRCVELEISRAQNFNTSRQFSPFVTIGLLVTYYVLYCLYDDKINQFFGFAIIFNELFLRAQLELRKKLGYYEYLLLAKRSFPGLLFV